VYVFCSILFDFILLFDFGALLAEAYHDKVLEKHPEGEKNGEEEGSDQG